MRHSGAAAVFAAAVTALAACAGSEPEGAEEAPASWPEPRLHPTVVFDPASERLVVAGGISAMQRLIDVRDVWAYDTSANTWEQLGEVEPDDAFDFQLDTGSGTLVAVNLEPRTTWEYDLAEATWQMPEPERQPGDGTPSVRIFGLAMAYDEGSDRIIAFGGGEPRKVLDDTWAYDADGDTWEEMSPATRPPARGMHAMAYDPVRDRVLMWGGFFAAGEPDLRMWAYDYEADSWEDLGATGGPAQHFERHGLAYLPDQDRLVMFSGLIDDDEVLGPETWSYDLEANTWTLLEPAEFPPALAMYGMAHDPTVGQVVLYGGGERSKEANELNGDVWVFDPEAVTWEHRPAPG